LRNSAAKIKTVGLAGKLAEEKLYVHGEKSATDAISLLAAPYKNNVLMIEGKGQFGSRLKPVSGIGAPRYTDVKRSAGAEAILYHDLDLIPLTDNYDGSKKQPVHFLPLIPTVLLNGVVGIGVGYSTKILPRALKTLVEATRAALLGEPVKLMKPTYERHDISVLSLGDNAWQLSGKATVVDTSTIKVTELPPNLSIEAFRERLDAMEEADEIMGFTDTSTRGINIEIRFKRGSLKGWTTAKAMSFLKLHEKITERIVVMDWKQEHIMLYPSAEELVVDFVNWRLKWYKLRYERMLADALTEYNYWMVLRALVAAGFTKRLGTFANRAAVEADVATVAAKAKIVLDTQQMDRVVGLPTYRWTKDYELVIAAEITKHEADIKEYKAIINDPARLKGIYLDELDTLKKFKPPA